MNTTFIVARENKETWSIAVRAKAAALKSSHKLLVVSVKVRSLVSEATPRPMKSKAIPIA
jgi:hypothetical protein